MKLEMLKLIKPNFSAFTLIRYKLLLAKSYSNVTYFCHYAVSSYDIKHLLSILDNNRIFRNNAQIARAPKILLNFVSTENSSRYYYHQSLKPRFHIQGMCYVNATLWYTICMLPYKQTSMRFRTPGLFSLEKPGS